MTRKSIKLFLSALFCVFLREVNIICSSIVVVAELASRVTFFLLLLDHDLHEISRALVVYVMTCYGCREEMSYEFQTWAFLLAIFGQVKEKWRKSHSNHSPMVNNSTTVCSSCDWAKKEERKKLSMVYSNSSEIVDDQQPEPRKKWLEKVKEETRN